MKKTEESVKPVSYETQAPAETDINEIRSYYSNQLNTQPMLSFFIHSLANNQPIDMQ
jgi:hypothetical protein